VEGGASGQAGNYPHRDPLSVTGGRCLLTTTPLDREAGAAVTIDARDRVEFDGVSFNFSSISIVLWCWPERILFNRVVEPLGTGEYFHHDSSRSLGGRCLTTYTFERYGQRDCDARDRVG